MKKIYNSPVMLCVELRTVSMMATSEYTTEQNVSTISRGSNNDEIDVKTISDKSLWDNEW